MPDHYRCDILIAGAGFAGALTALLLNRRGFSVCLVEKGHHPRFAIGESSTPIADLLLRDLSVRYDLPWLYAFSRYGSWQEVHPEIVCGIKRGFSYFKHYPGKEFTTDAKHSQELLVAASADDRMSDTNWLRSDFDAFLVNKVKETGIVYLDRTDIISAQRKEDWTFKATRHGDTISINCSFFIDSTGTGNLLDNQLSIGSYSTAQTNSYALFSHFDDVPRWTDQLKDAGIATHDFPYDPDHSALHQVLDEGWIWMLRFNDRRTSVGFALDGRKAPPGDVSPEEQWKQLLAKYPSIGKLLGGIGLSSVPGKLIRTGRLQRHLHCSSGPGWAALPHTAGFVDPLFSTGIAHTLTGIRRLVGILEKHFGSHAELKRELGSYSHAISIELAWIDNFVAGCYATMPYFELFQAWSMVYFAYTIMSEQRLLAGEPEEYYLGIDKDNELRRPHRALLKLFGVGENEFLSDRYVNAPPPSPDAIRRFAELVRESIAPYNTAGLMDPEARNMYRHTVAVL